MMLIKISLNVIHWIFGQISACHLGAAYNPQWKHMNVPGTQPSVAAQLLTDEVTQQYPIQAESILFIIQ